MIDKRLLILVLLTSGVSFMISFYLVPFMRKAAFSLNILDIPDNVLKKHKKPTPYLGGVAVYMAMLFTTTLIIPLNKFSSAFFLGATMITMIGFVDDMRAFTPRLKFLFQVIVVFIIIRGGIFIKIGFLPSYLNYFLTFLWLLLIINAFNFLDIMNGVAASVTIVALIFFIFFSSLEGSFPLILIATTTMGALFGFLYYNFPKARIFLGDSGSMLIGYIVGVLSFAIDYSQFNVYSIFSPVIILFIPLLEIAFTSITRILNGIPPWRGSPHHYIQFIKKRFGMEKTVYFLSGVGFLAGIISILVLLKMIILSIVGTIIMLVLSLFYPFLKGKINEK